MKKEIKTYVLTVKTQIGSVTWGVYTTYEEAYEKGEAIMEKWPEKDVTYKVDLLMLDLAGSAGKA